MGRHFNSGRVIMATDCLPQVRGTANLTHHEPLLRSCLGQNLFIFR